MNSDDRGKKTILTLLGVLCLVYAISPDPLPVVVDDIFAAIFGVKLLTAK